MVATCLRRARTGFKQQQAGRGCTRDAGESWQTLLPWLAGQAGSAVTIAAT